MKLLFYSVAVIAMCLLFACGSNNNNLGESFDSASSGNAGIATEDVQLKKPAEPKEENKIVEFQATAPSASDADTITENNLSGPPPTALQAGNPALEDWDKKIVKTARLTLELKDYKTFNKGMHAQLKRYGAYIASEQQTQSDEKIENSVVIKVPVAFFEDLMNSIGGDGIQVLEKNISTEDVTGQLVDTKSRITAKEQVRDRYLDLLKQAKSMKDILAVQDEINSIQEDLEAASGRVNYLSHNAAYSTVNLTYYQYLNGSTADTATPSFLTKIEDAFANGGAVISNTLIFFTSVWPLVLAGIILVLYVKKVRLKKV